LVQSNTPDTSWQLVAESTALLEAADGVLPAAWLRALHADPARRVAELIRRGQEDGAFRTDLPIGWLVGAVHYILEGAAEENRAGRLQDRDVARIVTATVQSILTAEG
jgi:hypothetical protein